MRTESCTRGEQPLDADRRGQPLTSGNLHVLTTVMYDMDSIDRQALTDAGLDPDDPHVWETQRRVSNLLRCHGMWLLGWPSPTDDEPSPPRDV